MPAKSGDKKDEVREVNASSKTAADIEAEIAATAQALGEAKTIKGTPTTVKKDTPEPKLEPVSPEKKDTSTKANSVAKKADESEGVAIVVKRKISEEEPSKEVTPVVSTPVEIEAPTKDEADDEPKIMGHKGKTISPLSEKSEETQKKEEPQDIADEVESEMIENAPQKANEQPEDSIEEAAAAVTIEETSEAEPEEEVEDSEPEIVEEEPKKADEAPEEPIPTASEYTKAPEEQQAAEQEEKQAETGRKLEAITGELNARVAKKPEDELQTAKIYDTKKYHVPIKVNRHHRRAAVPLWVEILILVIGLLGAVVYASWSDMISLELPLVGKQSTVNTQASQQPITTDTEQEEVVLPADKAIFEDFFNENDDINYGDASLKMLVHDTHEVAVAGHFYRLEDGTVLLDFADEDMQQNAQKTLNNQLKGLSYTLFDPFDAEQNVEVLPNLDFMTELTPRSLSGIEASYGNNLADIALQIAANFNDTADCRAALADYDASLNSLRHDFNQDYKIANEYIALIETCTGDVNAEADSDSPLGYELKEITTDDNITVILSYQNRAYVTVELSNFQSVDEGKLPATSQAVTPIQSPMYLDLLLMANCPSSTFNEYEKSVFQSAVDANCPVLTQVVELEEGL